MAPKKQPTNQDLLKEIKEVQATLVDHTKRIEAQEYWRMMVEAHEAAYKQVKKEERESKGDGSSIINKELLKALGLALTALVSLAAFIQASK